MADAASKDYGHKFGPEFNAKYEVTGVLGEGGMGQVLRGTQRGLGREVAIKLLTLRSYATPERRERFKSEAQRCAAMSHPNLVGVYDYGEDGERPYMVMELVDGESLADRIKREGTVPIREALDIGVSICEGLHYAHELGLVHRDIKSDNILLDGQEKQVKVADFGIAIESDDGSQKDNVIIGTPSYMSPEQASGKKADNRSDIYSTGVILYEMLTGKVPFTGETSMAIIIKHLNEQAASMTDLNPEVPPQLEEIILRSLEKKPEHRYQDVRDFASRLKKASSLLGSWQSAVKEGRSTTSIHSFPSGTVAISAAIPETQEERMRRMAGYAAVAVVLATAFAALIWVFVLAPPTYMAEDFQERMGFTQAALVYQSNHPCPTVVEYQEQGGTEVKTFRTDGESLEHEAFLESLREDTPYRWRPLFPAEQEGEWRDVQTKSLRFSDVRMSARVNGARVEWKTSLPVEIEVQYMQQGAVKEIVHLEGQRTDHGFTASFANPAEPYQIRLKATLDGRFHATHLIEEVPTINLQETKDLARDILKTVSNDVADFFPENLLENYERFEIRKRLKAFGEIREIFYEDAQVPSDTRMGLNLALGQLHEFDLYLAWTDPDMARTFQTGAADAFGPHYRAGTATPFSGGRVLSVLEAKKDMVFDPSPPPEPITGQLPDDAKDNAKYAVDLAPVGEPNQAFLEIDLENVQPNCYFEVEVGYSKRPMTRVMLLLPKQAVMNKRPFTGTLRARIDPRILRPKRSLMGWVRLRFLRDTVGDAAALNKVAGGFRGLRIRYTK